MKAKPIKAMIIDHDADLAKQFSQNISALFTKLQIQDNTPEAIQSFKDMRPQVLFINLTINQRSTNFEILEKLELSQEMPTVIFGYNDSHEPELLAHSLETGIVDIFVRPFDPDIISTKIGRYFQSEKTQEMSLQYSPLKPPIKAQVHFNFKLTAVDENGLSFKGEHYISKGTIFSLNNDLMKEIFENSLQEFMVTKTWISDDWKDYFLFAEPKDASEQKSAALRRFILRKI
jgi:DNA-binding response OmpR family regulator